MNFTPLPLDQKLDDERKQTKRGFATRDKSNHTVTHIPKQKQNANNSWDSYPLVEAADVTEPMVFVEGDSSLSASRVRYSDTNNSWLPYTFTRVEMMSCSLRRLDAVSDETKGSFNLKSLNSSMATLVNKNVTLTLDLVFPLEYT